MPPSTHLPRGAMWLQSDVRPAPPPAHSIFVLVIFDTFAFLPWCRKMFSDIFCAQIYGIRLGGPTSVPQAPRGFAPGPAVYETGRVWAGERAASSPSAAPGA
jgi:hypothetical protein